MIDNEFFQRHFTLLISHYLNITPQRHTMKETHLKELKTKTNLELKVLYLSEPI